MDILVTFEDGTTELRDADSPCVPAPIFSDDTPPQHPSEEKWYYWFHGEQWPLAFCGLTVRAICARRGRKVSVWRLTGHTEEPYTFTGEWQSCRVETSDEQIARLTDERDAARRLVKLHRIPLTAEEHVEQRGLVERAKREGWL